MPTERMEEVEVVGNGGSNCPACRGFGEDDDGDDCTVCDGGGIDHDGETPFKLRVAPGSLTAARLRLADAAEAWMQSTAIEMYDRHSALRVAAFKVAALRTVRGA